MNDMAQPGQKQQKRVSLRGQAYDILKRQILNCELKPGEAVTVTDLAEALGIGRTPVIQAVDRLMLDGLVEVMPRKGVVVSPVSLDDLVEIIEVRLLNEGQAARWAAERINDQQLAAMRDNFDRMRAAAKTRNISDLIALDSEFHGLINKAAGNSIMAEMLGNLHDRSLRFWSISLNVPEQNDRVVEQHEKIIEAMANHSPDEAEKAVRDHIAAFQSNIVSQIMRR